MIGQFLIIRGVCPHSISCIDLPYGIDTPRIWFDGTYPTLHTNLLKGFKKISYVQNSTFNAVMDLIKPQIRLE
jgi:hypothetical protein